MAGYVGSMPCPLGCGKNAAVSHSKTGVRNVKCAPPCSCSMYAPVGSKGARLIDGKTVPDEDSQVSEPAPAKPAATAPPAPKKSGGFSLDTL